MGRRGPLIVCRGLRGEPGVEASQPTVGADLAVDPASVSQWRFGVAGASLRDQPASKIFLGSSAPSDTAEVGKSGDVGA